MSASSATMPSGASYDYDIIKMFTIASMVWALVGMAAGIYIAAELAWPALNLGVPEITFGRLRPVHTNTVIWGFGGNALIATSFYIVQRTCQTRLWGSKYLLNTMFWAWQAVILVGAWALMAGHSQGREYAEYPLVDNILMMVGLIIYGLIYINTLRHRTQPHIYVANWFFMAFILATAILHFFNNMQVPYAVWQSYSVFSGTQDAMTEWWYGHNIVGFVLTVGFLGMMYYFVPKQAGRPIFSYRLSIVHFWALSFLYMWVGGHHLEWTALPGWINSLSVTFSILLLLPSWGGMINGIMTLSGAWDKLRTDPIILFLVTALAFYGMATFEGPMLALQSVNALSHYTDWTIGHVHSGALGWVAMITFGSFYHMVPRLWGTRLYSTRLVFIHFWLATIGIVLYIVAMWVAGIGQGLMLRAFDQYGNLAYTFVETVVFLHIPYIVRLIGGGFFFSGTILMVYNLYKTIVSERVSEVEHEVMIPGRLAASH